MTIFAFLTWVAFGVILGEMVGFFMETDEGYTAGYGVAGALGGIVGGVFGGLMSDWVPAIKVVLDGYNLTGFIFAMTVSGLFIWIDRKTYRIGHRIFSDARPDLP